MSRVPELQRLARSAADEPGAAPVPVCGADDRSRVSASDHLPTLAPFSRPVATGIERTGA